MNPLFHPKSAFSSLLIALSIFLITFFFLVLAGLFIWPDPDALIRALTSEEIRYAIQLSFITSVLSTVLCAVVALPVAYVLTRYRFPLSRFFALMISLPLSLPPIVAGIALLIFFGPSIWGGFLKSAGIDIVYTTAAIIIAQFFVNVPYLIRVMRSAFSDVSPRYEHVARTLGCTEAGVFLHISMPMTLQVLAAGLTITWSKAMGEFGAVLMLAGATRMKTETLPISLFLNISTGDLDLAIASAILLILISLVSLLVFEWIGSLRRIV